MTSSLFMPWTLRWQEPPDGDVIQLSNEVLWECRSDVIGPAPHYRVRVSGIDVDALREVIFLGARGWFVPRYTGHELQARLHGTVIASEPYGVAGQQSRVEVNDSNDPAGRVREYMYLWRSARVLGDGGTVADVVLRKLVAAHLMGSRSALTAEEVALIDALQHQGAP